MQYLYTFLFLTLIVGQARAQLTKIIYQPAVDKFVLGMSNAVLFNGKITTTVGTEPMNSPAGYPDAGMWAGKGFVLNEDGLVAGGQFQEGQYDHTHDIKNTPDGKLAIVYRYPTGNSYGFGLPYKIWNGTTIESTEMMYNEANMGIEYRLSYGADGFPRVLSFMAAGYALVYHQKTLGFWQTAQLTNFGTTFNIGNSATVENVFYFLVRVDGGSQIILFKIDGNNLSTEVVSTTSTQVHDMKLYNNTFYALYSQGNDLILSQRALAGAVWSSQTVVTESNHYKAHIDFDASGVPYVGYRVSGSPKSTYKISKKVGNTWVNAFTNSDLTYQNPYTGWGRAATLIPKNGEVFALYNDNLKVYLTNLSAVAKGLTASSVTATSVKLSWDITNGATFYKIFRQGTEIGTADSPTYTDTSLQPNTNYCYTFQACNGYGCTALSAPAVCPTTLTPFELTAVNVSSASQSGGANMLVRDCEKDIFFTIKNTTNLSLNYGLKVTRSAGGLDVLFEQANVTFAPNEEKRFDRTWVGDGTPNSSGIVFGGGAISPVGNYVLAIYACPVVVCPTVFGIGATPQNYIRTSTGISNPQNYAVASPDITIPTAPAVLAGEASAGFNTIALNTNTLWTASCDKTWVLVMSSGGAGSTTIAYTVAENDTGADRTATVTIVGCGVTKTYLITQKKKVPPSNMLLPTLFSPNGDGKNDIFLVRGSGIRTVELKMLNSKGNVVWQTNNLQEALEVGWKAEKMPDGVYMCNLRATFENGESKTMNQPVQILR